MENAKEEIVTSLEKTLSLISKEKGDYTLNLIQLTLEHAPRDQSSAVKCCMFGFAHLPQPSSDLYNECYRHLSKEQYLFLV